jgi:hypothetical protein
MDVGWLLLCVGITVAKAMKKMSKKNTPDLGMKLEGKKKVIKRAESIAVEALLSYCPGKSSVLK